MTLRFCSPQGVRTQHDFKPGLAGSSLILQWKWTRTRPDSKGAGSKNIVKTAYYSISLVLNSRVLLMYTDTVKEMPVWEFPFLIEGGLLAGGE